MTTIGISSVLRSGGKITASESKPRTMYIINHPHIPRADFYDCLHAPPPLLLEEKLHTALAVAPRGGAHGVVFAKASRLQGSDHSDFVMVTPLSVR